MTEIPEEFLGNNETIEKDFPPGPLAEHLGSTKKKAETVEYTIDDDFPPDGCGIGIGSSYRGL